MRWHPQSHLDEVTTNGVDALELSWCCGYPKSSHEGRVEEDSEKLDEDQNMADCADAALCLDAWMAEVGCQVPEWSDFCTFGIAPRCFSCLATVPTCEDISGVRG